MRSKSGWIRGFAAAALCLAAFPGRAEEKTAMRELLRAASADRPPAVAAVEEESVKKRPAPPQSTIACTMSFEYREEVKQLLVVRFWKDIEGTAVVSCLGREPETLRLLAGGFSLGVGIPNKSPFASTTEGISGTISIRLPLPFVPHHLEGDYVGLGVEIGGVGLTPWVNTDPALSMTIYMPSSFNAGAAINLQKMTLFLI